MLKLFIENKEIELNQDIQVAITKQFEDISNPTLIINDWSKTVSIPFTSENNKTFGYIFNEDRINNIESKQVDYMPNSPSLNGVWNGSGYSPSPLENKNLMSISQGTEYIRIATTNQASNTIIKSATYSRYGNYMFSFTKNPDTYYLEVGFIDTLSSASFGGLIAYFAYDVHNLINGQTYDFYFTYDKSYIYYRVTDTKLYKHIPTSGLLDNLPYTVEKRVGGQVIDIRDTDVYFNEDKTLKILDNGSIDNDSKLSFYTAWGNNSEHLWTISNLGIGNLGDNVLLPGYIQNPRTNNIVAIGFAFNFINASNESVIYLVKYDISSLPDGNYYVTWDYKYFEGVNGKVAGEVTHLYMTDYANVYWDSINRYYTSEDNIGIYFNPLKKLNFRVEWNDAVIMQGYAKMNEIKQKDGKGTYEITLFGELGKIFQEMKKITFNETDANSEYLIDGSKYVDENITKELVASSWNSTGQTTYNLIEKGRSGYNVTDIIGFAPNNSYCEGFDYKTYQDTAASSTTFVKVLEDLNKTSPDEDRHDFLNATGIEPSTAIPNGLLPREIGEYRSYLQLPYIYFNKLFQVFIKKAEEITGYQFKLSSNWFNSSNRYWTDLVYMLTSLFSLKEKTYNNTYNTSSQVNGIVESDSSKPYRYNFPGNSGIIPFSIITEQLPVLANNNTFEFRNVELISGDLYTNVKLTVDSNLSSATSVKIRNNYGIKVTLYASDGTTEVPLKTLLIMDSGSTVEPSSDYDIFSVGTFNIPAGQTSTTIVNTQINYVLPPTLFNSDTQFYFKIDGYGGLTEERFSMFVTTAPASITMGNLKVSLNCPLFNLNIKDLIGKSNSRITLNTLWNNEYNLFNEILNYTKMYRIGWYVDIFNKTITLQPIKNYMSNYSIRDWTDKVDKSKDWDIKPITFDNKYILFNYDDSSLSLNQSYKDSYGRNYGEYRLITEYNFNEEEKKLFDKCKNSISYTPNVLSWLSLLQCDVKYTVPLETYVNNTNKDNKPESIFGSYFFFNGLGYFQAGATQQLSDVYLTDDTILQQKNETYFYNQIPSEKLRALTYPILDVTDKTNTQCCLFKVPMLSYTWNNDFTNVKGIYEKYWSNYLKERYSVDNKIVTCYLKLSSIDYINFKFNQFVIINNQLYIVNKIYDYNITSNQSTKVDLITVHSIFGYTN